MREKELRLALICYGGISLAVYMHGITKEAWRLARASRGFHDHSQPAASSQGIYRELLEAIEEECGVKLRVLIDIVAGASAGGINGIYLAHAIASGKSLEPLTDLWLEKADVDMLLAPDKRPIGRFTKFWATPIAWMAARRRGGMVETTVDPDTQDEVSGKLSRFVRAKWFQPPFGGVGFDHLLLDAFEAIEATKASPPLLPEGQPLDLFVTVTDFHGYPQQLRLNSPPEITETEHRITLGFRDAGRSPRILGGIPALTFAARATASFPGAFPPFTVAELDEALAERDTAWPERESFLARAFPRQHAAGTIDRMALIDGSVLANAPFGPAIDALKSRPARREVDRRFVYIDPKPGMRSIGIGSGDEAPGFFRTIFGALSDIPREQPIADNLEAIEGRSRRIRRMLRIIEAIRPEVYASIDRVFGRTLFLNRPTEARLAAWRQKAQNEAAAQAGYAFASYGHLKLSGIVEDIVATLTMIAGDEAPDERRLRAALWAHVRTLELEGPDALGGGHASEAAIAFFRTHDLQFRVRRLRFLLRRIGQIEESEPLRQDGYDAAHDAIVETLGDHLERQRRDYYGKAAREAAIGAPDDPAAALAALAWARRLKQADETAEAALVRAFSALPKAPRRTLILAYLGFPFYDIATLPLLQGEGLDEFDPVKVDRIAPEDAPSIREGGAEACLRGIEFNSFGAFFSRAYRENDYLWGRLHGAERFVDIVISAIPEGKSLPPGRVSALKTRIFRRILDEERDRLTHIGALFDTLESEIG
ncbi:MAG: patatin-like protein [Parasphingopyxis sp.]|uniref:patatin-like protein n=1 Tax=Parasphingopyxis sp. TaxID=1920299 RepID=UPI0032ECFB38